MHTHSGIRCHCHSLVLAFKVVVHTHSSILSYHLSFLLTFKVISPQPCHSKSQFLTFISTSIAYLTFMVLHSPSFSSPCYLVFITYSSCSSRFPLPLHMTQSFEFATHISIMLIRYLTLSIFMWFTQSGLLWTHFVLYPKVVRPLLIFDIDLRVTFGDILEEVQILSVDSKAL